MYMLRHYPPEPPARTHTKTTGKTLSPSSCHPSVHAHERVSERASWAVFRLARRSFPDNGIALSNQMIYLRARRRPPHPNPADPQPNHDEAEADDGAPECVCERVRVGAQLAGKHTRTQNPRNAYTTARCIWGAPNADLGLV